MNNDFDDFDDGEYVECCMSGHNGYLVKKENNFYVVCEEFSYETRLPEFIQTESDAKSYLKKIDQAFRQGVETGSDEFKRKLSNLMGFVSRESDDIQWETHMRISHDEH